MQRRGSSASLPLNPQLYTRPGHVAPQTYAPPQNHPVNVGTMAARALTTSLTNPYGDQASASHYSYTNANYHAYFTQSQHPVTTAQGYTLSLTYVPQAPEPPVQTHYPSWPQTQRGRTTSHHAINRSSGSFMESSSTPGGTRCTYKSCSFTGSPKTVEIHMMDRHLIFPPGWKKKKNDWDADPSLKGTPVPIPGTGVILDTPEAIDAWIAERRKKWPTNQRVADRKRKAQEAADRGEIDPKELTQGRKKQRMEGELQECGVRGRGRGHGRGRGRGEWRGRKTDSGWQGKGQNDRIVPQAGSESISGATRTGCRGDQASSSSDASSDELESSSDMDPVKDAVSSKAPNPLLPVSDPRPCREDLGLCGGRAKPDTNVDPPIDEHVTLTAVSPLILITMNDDNLGLSLSAYKGHIKQGEPTAPSPSARIGAQGSPAKPVRVPSITSSPFNKLLLPEIRHTISNLSQAIHFLVENDFLEDVELKPGDADSQRIKVLNSSTRTGESDGVNLT